jgi:hypothetical protein
MFQFMRRRKTPQDNTARNDFAADAIWQLDKAMMILANAKTLQSAEDIKRSIEHAVQELEPVFESAKRRAAEIRGMPDADVN